MRAIPCPIEPDELKALYAGQKLTDQQIADRLGGGATVKQVRSWRRRFGVATINRTERHDVPPIEGKLRSLLIGSMLGDGGLARRPNTTHYNENHAAFQSEYAEWKRAQWGSWVKGELKPVIWKKDGKEYPGVRFSTVSHASLNEWHAMFYPAKGAKVFPRDIAASVDPFALAVWYMDDGCAAWWPEITMATTQRSVAQSILNNFGIDAEWAYSSRTGSTGVLRISTEDHAHRFIDIVSPHIPECMSYKLDFGFQGPHYQVRQAATEERLEELASQGVPIRRIAKLLGVGATTVDRYLRGYGIDHVRRVGRPLDTFGVPTT